MAFLGGGGGSQIHTYILHRTSKKWEVALRKRKTGWVIHCTWSAQEVIPMILLSGVTLTYSPITAITSAHLVHRLKPWWDYLEHWAAQEIRSFPVWDQRVISLVGIKNSSRSRLSTNTRSQILRNFSNRESRSKEGAERRLQTITKDSFKNYNKQRMKFKGKGKEGREQRRQVA